MALSRTPLPHGNAQPLSVPASCTQSLSLSNGLLINHQLVEVNGQNVVGMPDKELLQLIREVPRSVTLTIMPAFVYGHLVKKYGTHWHLGYTPC